MARGLTVREVAARYRVSPDKIRNFIRRGELRAINTKSALCGRPRWVVMPEDLAAFEKPRVTTPPPAAPRRKRTPPGQIDFFPD